MKKNSTKTPTSLDSLLGRTRGTLVDVERAFATNTTMDWDDVTQRIREIDEYVKKINGVA